MNINHNLITKILIESNFELSDSDYDKVTIPILILILNNTKITIK